MNVFIIVSIGTILVIAIMFAVRFGYQSLCRSGILPSRGQAVARAILLFLLQAIFPVYGIIVVLTTYGTKAPWWAILGCGGLAYLMLGQRSLLHAEVAFALGRIDKIEFLIQYIKLAMNNSMRTEAARLLEQIGDHRAADLLRAGLLLESDPEVRFAMANALSRIQPNTDFDKLQASAERQGTIGGQVITADFAKDPVPRYFSLSVLLIVAGFFLLDVDKYNVGQWSGVLFLAALFALYWGFNTLFQIVFGRRFVPWGFLFGAGVFQYARCGKCGCDLGGREYRDHLRHGIVTCPQCGTTAEYPSD